MPKSTRGLLKPGCVAMAKDLQEEMTNDQARMTKEARSSKHEDPILLPAALRPSFSPVFSASSASPQLRILSGLLRLPHWQAAACQCHPQFLCLIFGS